MSKEEFDKLMENSDWDINPDLAELHKQAIEIANREGIDNDKMRKEG